MFDRFDQVKRSLARAWTGFCRQLLAAWVRIQILPSDLERLGLDDDCVCYVLESRSFSNYLVLEQVALDKKLPSPRAVLAHNDNGEQAGTVFMRRRRGALRRRDSYVEHLDSLEALLDVAQAGREVKLVPVSIFWGRRPAREDSFFKALFSDSWVLVGPVRKFCMILLHGRHVLVHLNAPISLAEFTADNPRQDLALRKLSRVLRVHFRRQRSATIGPDLSHRRTLVNSLVSSRAIREAIAREASKKNISQAKAVRRAHAYAMEIAADYSYPVVRALDRVLTWVWNRLYNGVEVNHFETVADMAPGHELVYVPCHRSHMDYLLLSYVLYHQGLMPPHVAAGINLDLPVIGSILRRGGAFFIRRSFSGNQLYTAVMNEYLALNFAKGVPIEYFTEGARSRTGRLLKAREGMLAMSAKSYLRHPRRPVVFIPVYIGYEKIIELPSYVDELSGAPKKSETVAGFFKSLRALWRDWGRVHINVGEPIVLADMFARHEPGWRDNGYDIQGRPAWLPVAVNDLAQRIHTHINQAAAVNPINLVSVALLSNPKHALDEQELSHLIDLVRKVIRALPDHERVTVTGMPANEIIRYAERLRVLKRQSHELGDVFYLDARDSLLQTYYRNNVMHLLAIPALIACCFLHRKALKRDELHALCKRAYPMLRCELFLPWRGELPDAVLGTLIEFFQSEHLLRIEDERVEVSGADAKPEYLQALAHPLLQMLQRFYLCATLLSQRDSASLTQAEFEQLCELTAQRLALLHEFQGADLFTEGEYGSFLSMLKKHEWVWVEEERLVYGEQLKALGEDAEIILSPAIRDRIQQTGSVR